MSSNLLTFRKKHYNHYFSVLQFSMKDSYKCVVINPNLKRSNPELYNSVIKFVETNKLRICKENSGGE